LTTARYFSAYPSDPASRRTPCPPKLGERWLQVRLGRLRLSPACPFRLLHTFHSLRPARHYPRFWIQRSSSERWRDLNPPDLGAAQRTLRPLLTSAVRSDGLAAFSVAAMATRGRSPGVSSIAFGAQPPDLRFAPLMDMDFAIRCPLVRRLRLVSGFCPSARTFASRFLQTPPRGDSPCASLTLHLHQVG
jgi:hypothetical protein